MRMLIGSLAMVLGVLVSSGSAGIVLPTDVAPGTSYQLVFVTQGTPGAGGLASYYNNFVQQQANESPALAALGLTWTAIVSAGSSADQNAPVSGLVFTLDGTEVSTAADFYSSSHLAPIDINQFGNTLDNYVWTGSFADGTVSPPGLNSSGEPAAGLSTATNSAWAYDINASIFSPFNVYALSSVIVVPENSAVPEPSSFVLFGMVIAGLGVGRWRRRHAA